MAGGRSDPAALRRAAAELRHAARLRVLPRHVAWLQWRARRVALRRRDRFSLTSATRPADLAVLLELARGRRRIAELGTGTAWTSLALAVDDPQRRVLTYDPVARPERELYLGLVDDDVRSRVTFAERPGSDGPPAGERFELLYIDSSHAREDTLAELRAWRPALVPGAPVVFDDYTHPDYAGVREAVSELDLDGTQRGTLFVHRLPGA